MMDLEWINEHIEDTDFPTWTVLRWLIADNALKKAALQQIADLPFGHHDAKRIALDALANLEGGK